MADRTWNPVDAKLYDEDWSKGARIVAGILIARCPNQYGVFDMPMGFLRDFLQGLFTPMEIEGFCQEWEASGFVKFYRDRKIIWIVKKWKRSGKPNENHWKGLKAHLESFPEVRDDLLSLYEPHWRGMASPSEGDRGGMGIVADPPVNPESESESDPESERKKTDLAPTGTPAPTSFPEKPKEKKPYKPLRLRKAKTPGSRALRYWHAEYHRVHAEEYAGDAKVMAGQIAQLLRQGHPWLKICATMYAFLDAPSDKFTNWHNFDTFIKRYSKWSAKATEEGYEIEAAEDGEIPGEKQDHEGAL